MERYLAYLLNNTLLCSTLKECRQYVGTMAEDNAPSDWSERYRPASESMLEGNVGIRQTIRNWLEKWEAGRPEKKGMLLVGPPGVGKTTIARAIAADKGWNVIELNASDERNALAIRKAATRGATHRSIFYQDGEQLNNRTIVLLDEVDHLAGSFATISESRLLKNMTADSDEEINIKGDSGGKGELLNLLEKTSQPVILACNDEMRLWGRGRNWSTARDKVLRLARKVEFKRADEESKRRIARRILSAEKIEIDIGALDYFVRSNPGDLRALVKDLQILSETSSGHIDIEMVKEYVDLGLRDSTMETFPGLERLYRINNSSDAVRLSRLLDRDPDDLAAWVTWNNSAIFQNPAEIRRGAQALSVADMALNVRFTNRAYRAWYWGANLASLAATVVSAAQSGKIYISYPDFLRRGHEPWRRGGIIEKLSQSCGCSKKAARQELYPSLAAVHSTSNEDYDNSDFTLSLSYGLDGHEHITLCGLRPNVKATKDIVARFHDAAELTKPEEIEVVHVEDEQEFHEDENDDSSDGESDSATNQKTLF